MVLPRKHRLTKKDFSRIFRKGRTVRSSFFFIRFLNNDIDYFRAAVVVGTKISKKAVIRNRLRRILTEALRGSNIYREQLDVVIVATENIVGKTKKEINRELENAINKIIVK